ncbi:hypothetical protein K388_07278 [Streptomyces sp. KhCrAH-43]|uniref:hypothetical protein n=1 Tax=unclassified Streptomyces TaxID=2593676 RepID=UPI00035CF360|nr:MULTISPECIES: hypothetical protein [unclassified Streptomyces]MYS32583.1 hypothetical protein [Streptomyces sp. SID4920]MYX64243.1 hypothetical protein [Streptomyces sp. SID8373]RAJ46449.1 hypothetical protein K388_07278 [Streptomyces sp. KhCrAH-43]
MAKGKIGPVDWAMRAALWLYALVSVPLYLWFLHHMGDRWGQQLPTDDDLRFWLPIVVPLAAFSFTTMSSTSWWWSTEARPFLLGRKGWRFMMVFVVALSLMAGFFGSAHRDFVAVVLAVMVTTIGIGGLWLLPPALSPHLLNTLRPKAAAPVDPS